jgi:hypothetical protein
LILNNFNLVIQIPSNLLQNGQLIQTGQNSNQQSQQQQQGITLQNGLQGVYMVSDENCYFGKNLSFFSVLR